MPRVEIISRCGRRAAHAEGLGGGKQCLIINCEDAEEFLSRKSERRGRGDVVTVMGESVKN